MKIKKEKITLKILELEIDFRANLTKLFANDNTQSRLYKLSYQIYIGKKRKNIPILTKNGTTKTRKVLIRKGNKL